MSKYADAQIITTVAGTGAGGFSGDGGYATAAHLKLPTGVALDVQNNIYIADCSNHCIRRVDATGATIGKIFTVAGNGGGSGGYGGDGGLAISTTAQLNFPYDMAVDATTGNLYIADQGNYRIRMVDATGHLSTITGSGTSSYSGDGGPAIYATLFSPRGVSIDPSGNIYIADVVNHRVRRIDAATGYIHTYAGNGTSGYSGDNGAAASAQLRGPNSVVDPAGNLYISDRDNHCIRKVTSGGIITTVAGTGGSSGYSGDTGPATSAKLDQPTSVAVSANSDLYIADKNNHKVRIVNAVNHKIYTYAGNGTGAYSGDGVAAIATSLQNPTGVALDDTGNLYIADYANYRIRKVHNAAPVFDSGTDAIITMCEGSGPYSLNAVLSTTDLNEGQTIKWRIIGAPTLGTASVLDSAEATGVSVTTSTSGQVYTPPTTGTTYGTTTFQVQVSDGYLSSILTIHVIIYQNPAAIPVVGTTCIGGTATFTNTVSGGVWSSSGRTIATIDPTTGVVTGVSAGTVGITYTIGGICSTYSTITVSAALTAISGSSPICSGTPTLFTDGTGGGTWSSSDVTIASVDASTGYVYGIASGTITIYYSIATCSVSYTLTVIAAPDVISGPSTVCEGQTITLSNTVTGGTWSSSDGTIAIIDPTTGVVTGVTAGSAIIDYNTGGSCSSYKTITVNTSPSAIAGATPFCSGTTITPTSSSGGTWSPTTGTIATVDATTGDVYGIAAGTVTISYTIGTCSVTQAVTVVQSPNPVITGTTHVCEGSTIPQYNSESGGVWSSSASTAGIATIDASTGVVTGVSAGSVIITYTIGGLCSVTKSIAVTVMPGAIGFSTTTICTGLTTTFTDAISGGTWRSSNTSIVSISITGVITGIAAGTATITYDMGSGCFVTQAITVNPMPNAITGGPNVCEGSTITLTDVTSGGTWSSSALSTATVISSTGVVTGVASGAATISYTLGGCSVSTSINVRPLPASITGAGSVCEGSSLSLSSATAFGAWYSSNPSIASVTSTTVYTSSGGGASTIAGIGAGTATITYMSATYFCITTATVTVNPTPAAITGASNVCVGSTIALTDASLGFIWSTSSSSVASITGVSTSSAGSTATVSGVAAGAATITYGDASTGCNATLAFTVNPMPGAITGTTTVCSGSTTTLYDALAGGVWSSSDATIAAVGSGTGVVTGVAGGTAASTATITYTTTVSCSVTTTVTVNPTPTFSGPFSVCVGSTTTAALSASIVGGVWASSSPSVASIIPTSYLVVGVSAGTSTISYTLPSTCSTSTTFTVAPIPVISITSGLSAPLWLPLVSCGNTVPLTASGASTYLWSPSTFLTSTVGASTTVAGLTLTTTYIVAGTSSYGCTGYATETIETPLCDGSFCSYFSNPIYSLAGNIGTPGIVTNMPIGNYSVTGNVTFLGTVNFTNSVIAVAPALTLNVDAQSVLNIAGSHLFCCDKAQLWHGIVLNSGLTSSGRMYIGGNSMLEDAETAVKIWNSFIPATAVNVFTTDGTIFNKNNVGIDIKQFPATGSTAPAPPYTYPFLIRNSVFTSRDMSFLYVSSGYGYPMVWSAPSGTATALKAPYTPTLPLMPPYNVINPTGAGGSGLRYPYTPCNGGSLANIGIKLYNVGAFATSGIPNTPATFSDIVIGDPTLLTGNPGLNLFDTLLEGIYAQFSNFTCYDNAFIYMHKPPASAVPPNLTGLSSDH